MGVVVLVSGGIDSITMCKIIDKQGEKLLPLFVDYGQLAAEKEWAACQNLLEKCGFPEPKKIDLGGYGKFFQSGITDTNKDIYTEAFLPGRNMLFLLTGAAYAYTNKENKVAIGLLKDNSFPDQKEEFVVNTNFAINSALGSNFILLTPLINFDKSQVMQLAKNFGIPLDKTYSCHSGNEKYCGHCISCKEIMNYGGDKILPQFGRGDSDRE